MKLFIVLSVIVSITAAEKSNTDLIRNNKGSYSYSYMHKYDLAVILIILAIKFKAVLVFVAIIFWFGTYSKLFSGFGGHNKSFKCPPPVVYESPHKHHDWIEHSHSDRRNFGIDYSVYPDNMDLELISSVLKGVGIINMNFNATDTGPCKKWMVCEAEKNAYTKPVLAYTINLLSNSGNLAKYRTTRSANERTECSTLIPECRASTTAYTQRSYYTTQRQRLRRNRVSINGT